ncbi:oxygen-independent coproporphyrinogen III oxidase [Sphingosinicella rhizophila]|uniref:Coproporphyrinogen-III oxidase n=1 Tax=Sphingosinicella rhizophila TaxID=3050082 RepID=A0ABU3QBU2_9SPHN|nr:oxygen-independent coproporphyrinogen III oxidase [Sphingosinicella sp. GR2756]MDT9600875.1 oxygen-independent coproporphyrinogen III oxidase [Sphingosinicella sp. GR2756]
MRPEILARYGARQIPRYTSYPTAPNFTAAVGEGQYRAWLGSVPADESLSLYLHVPFCRAMCWYCGCHTTVTARALPVARYLDALTSEITLVAQALPHRMTARHLHFGGGSPTLIQPPQFLGLMRHLRLCFDLAKDAELAIEIDPRTLDPALTAALATGGINRASIGVQSFDPRVQAAINRVQNFAETADAVAGLRGHGIHGINFDLIYGLPHQTLTSCLDTVAQAVSLRPDRLSVFGYAHVPGFKKHQRKIEESALPDPAARLEQSQAIAGALVDAGYRQIGLDHFALPDDSLSAAAATGRLHRNFQGYTTDGCRALIGFGASSIGRLPGGYVQNKVLISDYQEQVAQGHLPIARGCAVSVEDNLRGEIIERLMCDYRVDLAEMCADYGADPVRLAQSAGLGPLVADGLIALRGDVVEMEETARPLVRAVAAAFDAYLDNSKTRHALAL